MSTVVSRSAAIIVGEDSRVDDGRGDVMATGVRLLTGAVDEKVNCSNR